MPGGALARSPLLVLLLLLAALAFDTAPFAPLSLSSRVPWGGGRFCGGPSPTSKGRASAGLPYALWTPALDVGRDRVDSIHDGITRFLSKSTRIFALMIFFGWF